MNYYKFTSFTLTVKEALEVSMEVRLNGLADGLEALQLLLSFIAI
jgi:hypothetical protein